jgi:hypothetical protein
MYSLLPSVLHYLYGPLKLYQHVQPWDQYLPWQHARPRREIAERVQRGLARYPAKRAHPYPQEQVLDSSVSENDATVGPIALIK